jgi:hypothetical protein
VQSLMSISYRGQVISSHYVKHLRDEICLARHRIFLQNKYKWSDQSWAAIAWDSFQLCGRRTVTINSSFRSKLVHSWLHLGTRRATQSAASSLNINTCPMCSDLEDFQHLLTCCSPRALRIRYAVLLPSGKNWPTRQDRLHCFEPSSNGHLHRIFLSTSVPGQHPPHLRLRLPYKAKLRLDGNISSAASSVLLGVRFMLRMTPSCLRTGAH